MPNPTLEFHPLADEEVAEVVAWYADRSVRAAEGFLMELDRAIDSVLETPRRWALGRFGVRRYLLHRFPFALVYREKGEVIEVIAVAHFRRRPGYWRSRL